MSRPRYTATVKSAYCSHRTLILSLSSGNTYRVPLDHLAGLPWIQPGTIIVYETNHDSIRIAYAKNPRHPWWIPRWRRPHR